MTLPDDIEVRDILSDQILDMGWEKHWSTSMIEEAPYELHIVEFRPGGNHFIINAPSMNDAVWQAFVTIMSSRNPNQGVAEPHEQK